jgi:hypothetical protein
MDVAIGVDSHKATLEVAALDGLGRPLQGRRFRNDSVGHRALLRWITGFDGRRVISIECSGTFGAALARCLVAAGEDVREVPGNLSFAEANLRSKRQVRSHRRRGDRPSRAARALTAGRQGRHQRRTQAAIRSQRPPDQSSNQGAQPASTPSWSCSGPAITPRSASSRRTRVSPRSRGCSAAIKQKRFGIVRTASRSWTTSGRPCPCSTYPRASLAVRRHSCLCNRLITRRQALTN